MNRPDTAVVVPTLRRPDSLRRALLSILAQDGAAELAREIVVADNSPEGSAAETVDSLRGGPLPLTYVHAPRPGVATARNAALQATDASLIAWLDDDEEAGPGWLRSLKAAQAMFDADVVFGPIRGRIPDETHWAAAHLQALFSRHGPTASGLTDQVWGCGNSLMRRATALPGDAPFETGSDQTGGEDDLLFQALKQRGGRFAWAADAWVDEHAPSHRATMEYALRRAFAYGQSPAQEAARNGRPFAVAKWMAVGAAQTLVHGATALALSLTRRPERAEALDRAARGLGKIFWTGRFEPRFYGLAEIRRTGAS